VSRGAYAAACRLHASKTLNPKTQKSPHEEGFFVGTLRAPYFMLEAANSQLTRFQNASMYFGRAFR